MPRSASKTTRVPTTTKETATKELIDQVVGRAVNEDDVDTEPLKKITEKVENKVPVTADDVFLAYVGGMVLGSTAVARRWVERNPAMALIYVAMGANPSDARVKEVGKWVKTLPKASA